PECRAAVAGAGRLLESLGHDVEESAPAVMFDPEFIQHFTLIIAADTETSMRAYETALGRPIDDDEIEPRNAVYRAIGRTLEVATYLQSRAWLGTWARQMADWWTDYDLLVTPTVGAPPPELGWFTADGAESEGQRVGSFPPSPPHLNRPARPPVSLPLHWTPAGLPVGVQLVAAFGREDLLIRI